MPLIEIRYTRPPGRVTVFRQQLVHETAGCVITLLEHTPLNSPMIIGDRTVLERGSPVVWFTFPGLWHDIGRFHTPDDRFTGYYANLLTPVHVIAEHVWETTDLFLDVWLDDRGPVLLDESELDAALEVGDVAEEIASRARIEAAGLMSAARGGTWPPQICEEWTLERARSAVSAREHGTPGSAAV